MVSFLLGLALTAHGATSTNASNPWSLWLDGWATPQGIDLPHLQIVYQDVAEDGISRGKSWRGTPFQIGDKTYAHGIAFNSIKHLLVSLGEPAERFVSDVGLENNDDTRRGEQLGNGSVTFQVLVGGKEVFASKVLRRKDGPAHLDIPLNGAKEFEIRVGDAGDGRGWDQALWGEATVILKNGSKQRLQDLPMGAARPNPFILSFQYAGANSAESLKSWKVTLQGAEGNIPDNQILKRAIVRTDPATGLEVQMDATLYGRFPAMEYVVHITNRSATNSPLLENIQALDTALPVLASGNAVLHWNKGGVASFDDFAPQDTVLNPGVKLRLQPGGGRSSSQVLPFFNVEGEGGGVIAAIGWTGEWAAEFGMDSARNVTLRAGMDRTHLVLHPGESIRTPRILLLAYKGDRWLGQNQFRQLILNYHRPTLSGKPLVAPITCGNWGGTAAAVHLDNIHQIVSHNLPIDYYWIDAEWYGQGSWYPNAGNWEVKKDLYPQGFKPLSDALRKSNRELMLWFEPERVHKGTTWYKEHHDWLLDGGDNSLLNLGNPDARKFLTDFISSKIDEFGLGCYRQDFNIDPLGLWRAADAPDRHGITEIRYIEGLYEFWDELLRRHPNLIIDNCASGGRRLDIETLGRATPFWRTDGPRDPIAHQCHTWGLMAWVPLSATSQDRVGDDYEFRSSMCSALCLNWWIIGDVPAEKIPANFPFNWAKATLNQYLGLRDNYYGDYYPLTGYTQSRDAWMAYQLYRPDQGKGVVIALRRPDSPYETAQFPLRGLAANKRYLIRDANKTKVRESSGDELMKSGLIVELKQKPGSGLFFYEQK